MQQRLKSTRRLLVSLLLTSFASTSVASGLVDPVTGNRLPQLAQTLSTDTLCLSPAEQDKLAKELIDLDKCRIDLKARQEIIDTRVLTYAGTPAIAWWQEPTTVVGGMVISASIASVITVWFVRR